MAAKTPQQDKGVARLAEDPAELARALDELQATLSSDEQSAEEAWNRLRSRFDAPEPPPWIARLREAAARGENPD
jgi:hypothetical protein